MILKQLFRQTRWASKKERIRRHDVRQLAHIEKTLKQIERGRIFTQVGKYVPPPPENCNDFAFRVYEEPPTKGLDSIEAVTKFFSETKNKTNVKQSTLARFRREKLKFLDARREGQQALKRSTRNAGLQSTIRTFGLCNGYQLFRSNQLSKDVATFGDFEWSHMPSEEKDAYNKIAIENRVRRDIYKNSVKMRPNDYAYYVKEVFHDHKVIAIRENPEATNHEVNLITMADIAAKWRELRYAQSTNDPIIPIVEKKVVGRRRRR